MTISGVIRQHKHTFWFLDTVVSLLDVELIYYTKIKLAIIYPVFIKSLRLNILEKVCV